MTTILKDDTLYTSVSRNPPHTEPAWNISQSESSPAAMSPKISNDKLQPQAEPQTEVAKIEEGPGIPDAPHTPAIEGAGGQAVNLETYQKPFFALGKAVVLFRSTRRSGLLSGPGLPDNVDDLTDPIAETLRDSHLAKTGESTMKGATAIISSENDVTRDQEFSSSNAMRINSASTQRKSASGISIRNSLTSVHTFWTARASTASFATARTSAASYITARSGPKFLSRLELWRPASNAGRLPSQEGSPPDIDQQTAVLSGRKWPNDGPFDCLVEKVAWLRVQGSGGGPSSFVRAAIRTLLHPLCDPASQGILDWDTATSGNNPIMSLVSEIEMIHIGPEWHFNREFFWAKAGEAIWEFAVEQPHLKETVQRLFPGGETFGIHWLKLLNAHGLLLDPRKALDWSGRGQHVQYSPQEEGSIPLVLLRNLGYGSSGLVEQVRCRRINLARKTIRCVRNLTREEAAKEVGHLQRLQHQHIVRLVGTYMLRKNLSILMYPATAYNLEEFLDLTHENFTSMSPDISGRGIGAWRALLLQLIACLANAMAFIHGQNTKHMDIKPTNILIDHSRSLKVYITDFGIARSYQCTEASFTNSPIACTPIYAAPEVAQKTTRGLPADIFSLGCVFMEIIATLLSTESKSQREALQRIRKVEIAGADSSYQANADEIIKWYEENDFAVNRHFASAVMNSDRWREHSEKCSFIKTQWINLLPAMLALSPAHRPSAAALKQYTCPFACGACNDGPEPFRIAE